MNNVPVTVTFGVYLSMDLEWVEWPLVFEDSWYGFDISTNVCNYFIEIVEQSNNRKIAAE